MQKFTNLKLLPALVDHPRLWPLRVRYRAGRWSSELLQEIAHVCEHRPTAASLDLYIDALHVMRGIDIERLEAIESLASEAGLLAGESALRILSHKLHLGHTLGEAERWVMASPRKLRRYPVILSALYAAGLPESDTPGSTEAHLMRVANQLLGQQIRFEQLMLASASMASQRTSIAVVGNAPTALQSNAGQRIDACDTVIRFNRAVCNDATRAQVGSRCTLWVMSPATSIRHRPASVPCIAVTGVSPMLRPSRYWQALTTLDPVQLVQYAPCVWYKLVARLQAPPSAGLLTLSNLAKLGSATELVCVGFSDETHDPSAQANHYADKGKASSRHNWPLETELTAELLAKLS